MSTMLNGRLSHNSLTVCQSQNVLPVDWEVLLPAGPARAHHVGSVIDNVFYIHGGVTKYGEITPSNKLFRLELSNMIWNEVREPGSPALSHHACVALDNRYMVLIGGWDGLKRTSAICAFDTQDQKWLSLQDKGFPEGAGLSSHAVSVLTNKDILVVGREGCLKTKTNRKHGTAYLLSGSVEKGTFTYNKISDNTGSRSGHTCNAVDGVMYIIGGRVDELLECHDGYTSVEPIGTLNSNFSAISKYLQPLTRLPNGRKNHVTIGGKNSFIIHGGVTFDGRSRTAVDDMFLIITKPEFGIYKIGKSSVCRAAHVCVNMGDRVIFHGGVGWKNVVYGDCYELKCAV